MTVAWGDAPATACFCFFIYHLNDFYRNTLLGAAIVQVHHLQGKEVSGFFWFRSELADTIDAAELEQLLAYFMAVHDLWAKCFSNKKMPGAPIFRFRQSSTDPSQLLIRMLRVSDETLPDAMLAEKVLHVHGQHLTLQ